MSTTQPLPTSNDPETLYAAVEGSMAGLGTDEVVFFHREAGRSHVMTRDVAHAFGLCRAFLPMTEHVDRILQALPGLKGQADAVRKVLDMFVANGLMESDVQFVSRFMARADSTQAPVSGLFLCAATNPGQLSAALDALAAHVQRFGFAYPLYVIDLEAEGELAIEHAAAIRSFAQNSGLTTRHITAARAAQITDLLTKELPDQTETLHWLLTPVSGTSGAARNLASLMAAGTRYLFLDSETALPLLRHPEYSPGLYADTRAYALRSFDSPQSAAAAGSVLDSDPLAAHLNICGITLAEALGQQPAAILQRDSLHGVVAAQAPWLQPDRRVAFTAVGRAGRFALDDPTLVFKLGPEARAGLTASRETYLATYRTPSLWAGLRRFGAGLGERLAPFAYDASALIPCTLPDAGKTVELQVALLRLAHPDSVDFNFPDALMQLSPGLGADDTLGRPDSAQCLSGFAGVVAQDLYASDPARRLAVMAAKLDDLAGGSDASLQSYLTEYLVYHRSSNVENIQQVMAAAENPPLYWLADLRAAVETQGKALVGGETPRLAGWPESLNAAQCAARFREQLQGLAAGLRAWPAAFDLARAQSATWRDALDA